MKFKPIIILFNLTMLFFLAVLIFLPRLMFNPSLSEPFWRMSWPLALILFLVFCSFNVFYFINRKLFLLLEKEDWPALVRYLEERVIQKGNYSPRLVRLLANSYLVLSDSASVMSLENKVSIVKPSLVDAHVLIFGTARILGMDIAGAVRFFETRKDTAKPAIKDWVRWYYGFALLLNRQYEESGEEFSFLARLSRDGVITGLSAYFLSQTLARMVGDQTLEFRESASTGKERVLKALPERKNWNREVSRLSSEIHAAAISKYMEDAAAWLYKGKMV